MRRIEVDPGARTAHAQGGVTLGELDGATQEHEAAVAGVHSREHREAFGRLR
jgi:FAD/FMN-containing dehydrogenase